MTDYHNNDGVQWTAAHWKTGFIIEIKDLPLYVAVTLMQALGALVTELPQL